MNATEPVATLAVALGVLPDAVHFGHKDAAYTRLSYGEQQIWNIAAHLFAAGNGIDTATHVDADWKCRIAGVLRLMANSIDGGAL